MHDKHPLTSMRATVHRSLRYIRRYGYTPGQPSPAVSGDVAGGSAGRGKGGMMSVDTEITESSVQDVYGEGWWAGWSAATESMLMVMKPDPSRLTWQDHARDVAWLAIKSRDEEIERLQAAMQRMHTELQLIRAAAVQLAEIDAAPTMCIGCGDRIAPADPDRVRLRICSGCAIEAQDAVITGGVIT